MLSLKRLSLLMLPAVLMLLVAACGDDPTPTPTSPPPPPEEPTPTPTVALADQEGVIFIEAISYEDDLIELRIGPDAKLGYDANTILKSNEGNGWIIKLDIGDVLAVGEISQTTTSTVPHSFIIKSLVVGFPLDAIEGGAPVTPWKFTFLDEGVYAIGDAHEHGSAVIIVGDPDLAAYIPVIYLLDEIRVRDTVFAINVGDTLSFPDGLTGSGSATETHFITIDEFGINAEIAPGADTNLGLTITPENAGTFKLYCSLHPEPEVHGNFFIVVNEPPVGGGAQPVAYILDKVRIRDDIFDVRTAGTAVFGYPADSRLESGPGHDTDPGLDGVFLTINLGDSIVFEAGIDASSGNTETHFFTIDELGLDIELAPDAETGGSLTIAPTEPGNYRVYCSAHPDDHGIIYIIVVDQAAALPSPVTYALDKIRIRDDIFDVRTAETAVFGYAADSRLESGPGHDTDPGLKIVLLTINLGDSISFEDGIDGSNSNADTHFFTIDDLGIDIQLAPGEATDPGFTIKPTEAGSYRMYCSAHPDAHGDLFIIVR